MQLIVKHYSVLYIIQWASIVVLVNYSNVWRYAKLEKPLLSFSRANPSRLGFRKARTLNLSQAKCSFFACQSPHWLGLKAIELQEEKWRPPSVEGVGVAKEDELTVFKQSPLRCFKSDSHIQGIYVKMKEWSFQRCFWICSATKVDKVKVVQRGLHKAQRFTRMIMLRRTRRVRIRRSQVGSTSKTGWSCTNLRLRVWIHAGESKRRSRGTTTGWGKASQERRQGWRWKLVIIYHATDIVCSFHCQIIDCYDL